MISKTQITKRIQNKRNPEIVETIKFAKKNNLLDLAKKLSAPASQYLKINLDKLNEIKEDKILIVGKILGQGEIEAKKEIIALGFSEQARDKLKKAGCNVKSIKQELKDNKELKGVKIV